MRLVRTGPPVGGGWPPVASGWPPLGGRWFTPPILVTLRRLTGRACLDERKLRIRSAMMTVYSRKGMAKVSCMNGELKKKDDTDS